MNSFKNLLNSLKNDENSILIESFNHAFDILLEESLPVDPEQLSTEQLNRINKFMVKLGYDWRGADDAKRILARHKENPTEDMVNAVNSSIPKKRGPMSVSEKATRHFGATGNFITAGWLNTKGTLIDLGGKRGSSDTRAVDHSEVGVFLDDNFETTPFKIKVEFMKMGNIRLIPEQPGFNLIKRPTKEQSRALDKFIRYFSSSDKNGIMVEIWNDDGRSTFNKEYPLKTHPSVILRDVFRNTPDNASSEPLNESMDMPNGFSIDELKQIKSFSGRIKYIKDKLPRLGRGSSRSAYEISNDRVLKLAMNKKGLDQNMTEIDVANLYDIVPKVFDYDDDNYTWSIVEKVTPIKNPSVFEEKAGITFENFLLAVRYELDHRRDGRVKLSKPEFVDDLWNNNEFFMNIIDMAVNYDMPSGDLLILKHYGVGSDGKIKLIDAGLTNEVWKTHYKR